jgi:hypothetical protein
VRANRVHNQSCKECKATIYTLLADAFGSGEVLQQHRLRLPTGLHGYKEHPYFAALTSIESQLKRHRGFEQFVSRPTLPPVDFFVRSTGLIVEFDETQHFTRPRAITLEWYPETLALGFEKKQWQRLCAELKRQDNSPPYRDEQRAWFDTLRDFAPVSIGGPPVVRIYAGDEVWCQLDLRDPRALLCHAPRLAQALNAS